MDNNYTVQKNIQIFIAELKAHNIRKVVASPGTTNVMFIASIQKDGWFEIYSAADERSAAYIACGMAAESGEPVVLSCTGATASRNYLPGLTEAYYRKLPVLAVTSLLANAMPGQLMPQVIDRSTVAKDAVKMSVSIPEIRGGNDEWKCTLLINQALTELRRNGGGPVHVNLVANFIKDFSAKTLPEVNVIERITVFDEFPKLPNVNRLAVFVGSHKKWTEEEIAIVERFCELYNAVVFTDHTGNYKGKHQLGFALVSTQEELDFGTIIVDLMIDLGDVTGNYYSVPTKEAWRVSEDGSMQDRYAKLTKVFEMPEIEFFRRYVEAYEGDRTVKNDYLNECCKVYSEIYEEIPELPFSNIWMAKEMSQKLPENSVLHLGILNSLRAWNFFKISDSVLTYSNVGGFGIDGGLSTLIGASLVNQDKLYYGIIGDLAFFYDMNSLGNRHVGNNLRIMLVNNGRGTEFRNYCHPGAMFGDDADAFIAAGGHYGNKSSELVKHYANDLGFEYISALNKEEFNKSCEKFLSKEMSDKPILFEVFTNPEDESDALQIIRTIRKDVSAKKVVKEILGEKNVSRIKNILGR